MRRATLSLGLTCSNACVFCAQDGAIVSVSAAAIALPSADDVLARLAVLRDGGAGAITFTGGEPTLAPDALRAAVLAARDLGFSAIGVQTNGRGLAPLAASLAAAGLTDVHLSLHGSNAGSHDYHTGREGSFDVLWAAAGAARAASLRVVVTTVLTRSSFRVLSEIPPLLQARGVAAWHIAVPLARGRAADAFDRVYPRLALALPFAIHALELARRLGVPAFTSGAPLCLLGPFAVRSITTPEQPGTRAFHARCEGCAARAACPGVDPTYLARFDGDELRARDDLPASADAEPLAALFVGAGALAPELDRTVHEPAQASRKALPMYGRLR